MSSSPSPPPSNSDRKKTPTSWDPHDDMVLRHLKEQLKLGWKEIAANFPNRTTNACQFRWRRLMSGNLRSSKLPAPTNPHESITSLNMASEPIQIPGSSTGAGAGLSAGVEAEADASSPNSKHYYYPPPTPIHNASTKPWSKEEDDLLSSRRDLRTDELTLLLPQRSEGEILSRVSQFHSASPSLSLPSVSQASSPASLPSLSSFTRDRSSSTSSTASSISVSSSSPYMGADFGRRPILAKPRTPCFDGLKKLPAPVSQRSSSIPYSPASGSSAPSDWAFSVKKHGANYAPTVISS